MGDRTTASITLTEYDFNKIVEDHYKGEEDKFTEAMGIEEIADPCGGEIELIDYQANYGHIEILENLLQESYIEYNLRWESGGDYGAGEEFCRRDGDAMKIVDLYEVDSSTLDVLKTLRGDPANLLANLEKKILELEPWAPEPLQPNKNNTQEYVETVLGGTDDE